MALRLEEHNENEQTTAQAKEGKGNHPRALPIEESYGEAVVQYVQPEPDREGKTVGDRAPEVVSGNYLGEQPKIVTSAMAILTEKC